LLPFLLIFTYLRHRATIVPAWIRTNRDLSGPNLERLDSVSIFHLMYFFMTSSKSIVWTYTLYRTQVDKNRQNRT